MNPILDERALDYADKALREKAWEPVSDKNKMFISLGMGLVPIITDAILRKKIDLNVIPQSIAMGALGYSIPTIVNKAMEKKEDERRDYLKSEFQRISLNSFNKEASAIASVGNVFTKALKYSAQGVKDFGRGLIMPIKGKNISETALSVGSKAILGYGAYKSGKYITNKMKSPNYVDYLRNQVLAGNIKPNELSESDLNSVRKLGMN